MCIGNVSSSLMVAGPHSKALWDILAKWGAAETQRSSSPAEGSALGGCRVKAALNFHGPGALSLNFLMEKIESKTNLMKVDFH